MPDARSTFENFFAAVIDEITDQLDRDERPVALYSVLQLVADEMFADNDEAMWFADDVYNDVIGPCSSPLVQFGYNEQPNSTPMTHVPNISLDLLDLGGETVFATVSDTWDGEGPAALASFARTDIEGLRSHLLSQIAFGASTGATLPAGPERISFAPPLTKADIRDTLFPLAASSNLEERGPRVQADSAAELQGMIWAMWRRGKKEEWWGELPTLKLNK